MQKSLASVIGALLLSSLFAFGAQANEAVKVMTEFYKTADARPFDPKALAKFYSDKHVNHDPRPNQQGTDKEDSIGLFTSLAVGAPDSRHEITFIEAVGEKKALVRWKFKGTHTGDMLGIPATGKTFDIAGMELWEIKDGKIVGIWHVEEIAKLLQQLGLAK